ncbi:MAG: hypothetical protein IJ729_08580 [Alloprevotella sp.]|nr:hypothetical protein [Alloprevotella sp.]
MRKITSLSVLLAAFSVTALAQVTTPSTAGDWMTVTQFKAMAGTGQRFALTPVSTNASQGVTTWFRFTADRSGILDENALFTLEAAASDGFYTIKRASDGKYANTGGAFSDSPLNFYVTSRTAGDHADNLVGDYSISFDQSNGGNHFNSNALNWGAGTGGWSAYAVYGPIYKVTVSCTNAADNSVIQEEVSYALDGATVTAEAPELPGYTLQSSQTSATVNGADVVLNMVYAEAVTHSVTYVVKDRGTTVFSSDPVTVNEGTVVTELPSEYQRAAFYSYNTVNVTVDADQEVVFTATLKEDIPVNFTLDAESPLYYNLKIRGNYLVRQSDNSVRNQSTSEPFNPAASWAFIGNPYAGFRVINQEAGANYFLMYDEIRIPRHAVECTTLREGDTRTWIL